jgi:hypothetical protein
MTGLQIIIAFSIMPVMGLVAGIILAIATRPHHRQHPAE